MDAAEQRGSVSIARALEQLREAGRRVVADELELARLDAEERLARKLRAGTLAAAAALLAVLAWCALQVALALLLGTALPVAAAVAVVGALNLAIAGVLGVLLWSRTAGGYVLANHVHRWIALAQNGTRRRAAAVSAAYEREQVRE